MNGRKWSDGCISINLSIFAPQMEKGRCLDDYLGGIMDSLDGSHGYSFTYLPIIYQDDSQVFHFHAAFMESDDLRYTIDIEFTDGSGAHTSAPPA